MYLSYFFDTVVIFRYSSLYIKSLVPLAGITLYLHFFPLTPRRVSIPSIQLNTRVPARVRISRERLGSFAEGECVVLRSFQVPYDMFQNIPVSQTRVGLDLG